MCSGIYTLPPQYCVFVNFCFTLVALCLRDFPCIETSIMAALYYYYYDYLPMDMDVDKFDLIDNISISIQTLQGHFIVVRMAFIELRSITQKICICLYISMECGRYEVYILVCEGRKRTTFLCNISYLTNGDNCLHHYTIFYILLI